MPKLTWIEFVELRMIEISRDRDLSGIPFRYVVKTKSKIMKITSDIIDVYTGGEESSIYFDTSQRLTNHITALTNEIVEL